uniref:Plastid-encoded RNA polymerase subunit alpha n=1 Tax=Udotea flabellum TaxID=170437 RepID=A0A386B1U2_9CHLO|nr:RNA polymerase a-subunit [Udotea flabellum]AYC65643.1 RNA polymerase a-subunit [Udotea flabellum]
MNNIQNFSCISLRVENTGQLYGCFKIGPFSGSQSLTFANSLRRTLLAHQSKCIFNVVQIYGVEHEFSSLLGVRESVVDILLNLEKLAFQTIKPITKPQIAFVNFCGPGILQAKHISLPSNFKCINPSQYIATLEVDGQLMFKLFFPPTCEFFLSQSFSAKSVFLKKKKQWSNPVQTNYYCLNIFSQKFSQNLKKKKLIFNKSQRIFSKKIPKKGQENFLFFKSSLNVIKKVNYTLQPFVSKNDFQNNGVSLVNGTKQFENMRSIFNSNIQPLKLNCGLELSSIKNFQKKKILTSKPFEFIIFEIWTNGSLHPQTAFLKAINELLLEFFPYSLKISKIRSPLAIPLEISRFKKIKRKYITNLSKNHFRENFLNLEISNFYFDFETLLFLKNNKVHRILDFLIFLQKINTKNSSNSHFYNINKFSRNSQIQTTLSNFKKFVDLFL